MKKSLIAFVFLFLTYQFSFAFQNTSSNDLEKKLTTFEFQVESINYLPLLHTKSKGATSQQDLPQMKDSPFMMLSAFIEIENFDGQVFYEVFSKGKWSEKIPFKKQTHGKTPGRTVYLGGEVDGNAETIIVYLNKRVEQKLNVRLFAPGHSSEKNQSPAIIRNVGDCVQPPTCGRACWCPNGNCPQDPTPFPTTPTHIIVHHSAGQTNSSDFAAVVRSYYDLHVNTNGWDDIGYNWLVDGNGVIYEGRGSMLQGAHFSCMNENTTGICVIGNYVDNVPTSEAIQALQDLIAWEASDKEIEVLDADLHVSSGLNLDNISGHLDGNDSSNACSTTVCPGQNLYDLLGPIRDEVSLYPCLNDAVNVNALLENESIEIYPNPVQDYFEIKWENVTIKNIEIFDAIGRRINFVNELPDWSSDSLAQQNQRFFIKTNGVYFLKIELEDARFITKKIIVK